MILSSLQEQVNLFNKKIEIGLSALVSRTPVLVYASVHKPIIKTDTIFIHLSQFQTFYPIYRKYTRLHFFNVVAMQHHRLPFKAPISIRPTLSRSKNDSVIRSGMFLFHNFKPFKTFFFIQYLSLQTFPFDIKFQAIPFCRSLYEILQFDDLKVKLLKVKSFNLTI